jgi:hypothetical protein
METKLACLRLDSWNYLRPGLNESTLVLNGACAVRSISRWCSTSIAVQTPQKSYPHCNMAKISSGNRDEGPVANATQSSVTIVYAGLPEPLEPECRDCISPSQPVR